MALLEWGAKKFTIAAGDVLLGSDASCPINLTGAGVLPKHAILQGLADGQVVIRKAAPAAEVLINGVRLGAEPTPLLHGDKVEVGGVELTFVDERRSGSTQYVQAVNFQQAAAAVKAEVKAVAKPTGNTGGRVVCLTDGREYAIAGTSLVFGREAGCDVVVPGKDVSRRHAEIMQTPKGYLVVDSSTNGTFVNEQRVEGQRLLARADVIRIGDENFRFYADVAPAAPPPTPPPPAGSAPSGAPPAPTPAKPAAPPPAGAGARLQHTMHGVPGVGSTTAPAAPAALLGTFLIRSGALKGQRLPVKTPIVNIGRADYNDLVIPDESISTSHAKLQRREGIWVLVDLDSTNGVFVDGERISGEATIAPGASVRFGEVSAVFDPTDDSLGVAKGGGTKMIQAMKVPEKAPEKAPAPPPKAAAAPPPAAKPAPAPPPKRAAAAPPAPQKKGKGCGASMVVFLLGSAAFVYWILA